jgi:adenosylcobinamide-phosphate synthase
MMLHFWILAAALLLDWVLADPWGWLHPVQVMGWFIHKGQGMILAHCSTARQQSWAGTGLLLILGVGSFGYAAGLIELGRILHPLLGFLIHTILLASCLGARSLRLAALDVLAPLQQGDLVTARQMLSRIVGRDTDHLQETEILRALVETVAENTPDGATAPLFYAALGGAPLAFAYKAVSTLDSMIGYRREPFTHLGRASALFEDRVTWIPCRLTVATLALWSGQPYQFWQACQQEAHLDPSPNSGWSEAAFARILGVQLGGVNVYHGTPREKPKLGVAHHPLTPHTVLASLTLLRRIMLSWIGVIGIGVASLSWIAQQSLAAGLIKLFQ